MSNYERAVLDRRTSAIRHALKNRLAAIRNAAFYLERKASKAGLADEDPRVAQFFELIERELGAADDVIAAKLTSEHLLGPVGQTTPP